jgi:hypothetical protein
MRRNAFGQLIPSNVRFFTDAGEGGGGGADNESKVVPVDKDVELGFPKETRVDEMTAVEQAAYWKHQSRKHEKTAKDRADYSELKAKADQFDEEQRKSESEHDRKLREAAEAARREGENIGAQRYLRDAIRADLRATTGKSNDDLKSVMDVIDITKFVNTDGDIDSEKLTSFASQFGVSESTQHQPDPVRAALVRGSKPKPGTAGASVKELQAEAEARMTKKK